LEQQMPRGLPTKRSTERSQRRRF